MKNYLFIGLLLFFVFSCTENMEKIPDTILPMNKMTSILIDVHLVEASLSTKNMPKDSATMFYNFYKKDIYKKHSIDDSLYKKSFEYYASHPALMDKIYERVIDSLSLREEQGE